MRLITYRPADGPYGEWREIVSHHWGGELEVEAMERQTLKPEHGLWGTDNTWFFENKLLSMVATYD